MPRKRAIEIPAIRQVTRAVDESEHIHERQREQTSTQSPERRQLKHPFDDLYAIELIAMHCARQEERRPGMASVHDVNGHLELRVGIQIRRRQVDERALTGRDRAAANGDSSVFLHVYDWYGPRSDVSRRLASARRRGRLDRLGR
jgi:hypothetical protein